MTDGEGLLDTSAVIALPTLSDPSQLPPTPFISTITLAELSVGTAVLHQAETDVDPLPFVVGTDRRIARVRTISSVPPDT